MVAIVVFEDETDWVRRERSAGEEYLDACVLRLKLCL